MKRRAAIGILGLLAAPAAYVAAQALVVLGHRLFWQAEIDRTGITPIAISWPTVIAGLALAMILAGPWWFAWWRVSGSGVERAGFPTATVLALLFLGALALSGWWGLVNFTLM